MKTLSNIHFSYGKNEYDYSEYGTMVHEVDVSEPYEVDEAKLLEKDGKYTYLNATGCSCWDGDWEGWAELTLAQLRKLARKWMKDSYGAEKEMGKWITENLGIAET